MAQYTVIWRPTVADYASRFDHVEADSPPEAVEAARRLNATECEIPFDEAESYDLFAVIAGHVADLQI